MQSNTQPNLQKFLEFLAFVLLLSFQLIKVGLKLPVLQLQSSVDTEKLWHLLFVYLITLKYELIINYERHTL